MTRLLAVVFACFLSMGAWGGVDTADPVLAALVEHGVETSETFAGLVDSIVAAGDRAPVSLAFGSVRGARAITEITLTRDADTGYVVSARAAVTVNWGATRSRRLGAIAHELVHVLRLLGGSTDEGRGSDGEGVADATERAVVKEVLVVPLRAASGGD